VPTIIERMDGALYPGLERNWDDSLFRERILAHMRPESVVLDLGAGAGILPHMNFRGIGRHICGVDIDPRVVDNPMLDEGKFAHAQRLPFEENHFDIVFANNVLEHLEDPEPMFREVARVLKPNGVFLFKTPNKWHYVTVIARLTPHGFHRWANRWRGRSESDIFPTRYLANSTIAIARLAEQSGLRLERLEHIEGRPEYLRFSWFAYLLGAIYERLVGSIEALAVFRVLLVGTLRKPEGG
jgi:SAM-dependent methyltransferase